MKKIFFLLCLLIFTIVSYGQTKSDTIEINKGSTQNHYLYNRQKLKIKQISNLVESSDEAQKHLRIAKLFRVLEGITLSGTSYLIGTAAGLAANGSDPEWTKASAGIGLGGLNYIFKKIADSQIEKSVESYNSELRITYLNDSINLNSTDYSLKGEKSESYQNKEKHGSIPYHKLPHSTKLVFGLNYGIMKTDYLLDNRREFSEKNSGIGLQFGLLQDLPIKTKTGLRTGYLMSFEGKYWKQVYGRIPVLGQMYLNEKWTLNGGLNFDFWICRIYLEDITIKFKPTTLSRYFNPSLNIGTDYKISNKLYAYANIIKGLNNMCSRENREAGSMYNSFDKIRLKKLIFEAGIAYKL